MSGRERAKWLALLFVAVVLFYWKILLTSQFSVLLEYEGTNQAYAWDHFAAASIKQGIIPLWDPYTLSGHSFIGEMQTGLFYPPKLVMYLWPFARDGLLSQKLLHWFFALTHWMAACFMFLLATELGLAAFPSFVAALCFALGGFIGKVGWPDMLNTAIWLPLILLFLIRALRSPAVARAAANASYAGLALGMSILAGRIHIVMMHGLVLGSAAAYFALCMDRTRASLRRRFTWAGGILLLIMVVGFATGAVQLLPSIEYSRYSVRFLGTEGAAPAPSSQKIAYEDLSDGLLPRALASFLFFYSFSGRIGSTEMFSPYVGVLPLLLAIVGVWRNWQRDWTAYLAGLAVTAFLYTLGEFSLLHGALYATVPYLWMSRAAVRFILLTHLALALLAGLGIQTLLNDGLRDQDSRRFTRMVTGLVITVSALLWVPAVVSNVVVADWHYHSYFLILASWGTLLYAMRGGRRLPVLAVALILFDFHAFDWGVRNKAAMEKAGLRHMPEMLSFRGAAEFLRSQPGLFRIRLEGEWMPNVGETYGLYTTGGMGATTLTGYLDFLEMPRGTELLNVRYVVKRATATDPNPVYTDGSWKIYERSPYLPRAWMVHTVVVEPSDERARQRVSQPEFEPRHLALVTAPLDTDLDSGAASAVTIVHHQPDRIELKVRAGGRGLLVLSEIFYPGWQATVNGSPARIHKVNGLLRGVVLPPGTRDVILLYAPGSVSWGALLTILGLCGTGIAALINYKARKPPLDQVATA